MIQDNRNYGAIYTPDDLAQFLTEWAVRDAHCNILDLGTGQGKFVFAAYHRLQELGASPSEATQRIYGTEIDTIAWNAFRGLASKKGLSFPNIHNRDFFDTSFPFFDAVIGNPPYVRRSNIVDIERIRDKVLDNGPYTSNDVSRLADLYVYFLLHGIKFLKPDGRLAVITADPWLNVGYGSILRDVLLQNFRIENLVSIDRPIFKDAQVKPVLLLAQKTSVPKTWAVDFMRVKNGMSIQEMKNVIADAKTTSDFPRKWIQYDELTGDRPWSIYFKAPTVYEQIASHHLTVPLREIATAQIGYQTLAKEFFVLSASKVRTLGIEPEFLEPLAQSSQYFSSPVIDNEYQVDFFVFYCNATKEELSSTRALAYIEEAEQTPVKVRGKNQVVIGYQNKKRIQQSGRKVWYDLKTVLEKRGRAEILIPRLVYKEFKVLWNKAAYVPGELFIEFVPRERVDPEVCLAVFNSTVTEIMFRCHAQVYGGGTYNMNSGEVKNLPIININQLSVNEQSALKSAYLEFIQDPYHSRSSIDKIVFSLLDFDESDQANLKSVLQDLIALATLSKRRKSG